MTFPSIYPSAETHNQAAMLRHAEVAKAVEQPNVLGDSTPQGGDEGNHHLGDAQTPRCLPLFALPVLNAMAVAITGTTLTAFAITHWTELKNTGRAVMQKIVDAATDTPDFETPEAAADAPTETTDRPRGVVVSWTPTKEDLDRLIDWEALAKLRKEIFGEDPEPESGK